MENETLSLGRLAKAVGLATVLIMIYMASVITMAAFAMLFWEALTL
jgi:hypothetical protein